MTKDKVPYRTGMDLFAAESDGSVRTLRTGDRVHNDYATVSDYDVPMVNIGSHYASAERAACEADLKQRLGDKN